MSKLYNGYEIAEMITKEEIREGKYLYIYTADNKKCPQPYIINSESIWSTEFDYNKHKLVPKDEISNGYLTDSYYSFEIIEDEQEVNKYIIDCLFKQNETYKNKIKINSSIIKELGGSSNE